MAVTFKKPKKRSGNTHPRPLTISLDQPGRLRVGHWLTLLDISAPTFYARLKAGKVPAASGNDGRPYWTTAVVRDFMNCN
ncbi:hypothetical protein [Caballeronia grimmiae]|uniref:hypothetical protein n=1 Tax=Caballeronia grimmiae TaxID=1071679 RepID=UPI0038B904E0